MANLEKKENARTKLLNAAMGVVREKGYTATSVDELCEAAGVTKGAFFHHFKSKEDLAVAAANYWSEVTGHLFASAPYRKLAGPLDRVFGYLDFRAALVRGTVPEFTCLVGTMVQEAYSTNPAIRDACQRSIFGHAAEVAKDIAAAKAARVPHAKWDPESVALHTQAVIQGAFILAKAKDDSEVATESIGHLRRYIEFLFHEKPKEKT